MLGNLQSQQDILMINNMCTYYTPVVLVCVELLLTHILKQVPTLLHEYVIITCMHALLTWYQLSSAAAESQMEPVIEHCWLSCLRTLPCNSSICSNQPQSLHF